MKKIIIRVITRALFILGLTCFLLPVIASASTEVTDQHIANDTHWTKEGSPYLLTNGQLIIDQDVMLTIDPGVIIKSDQNSYVQVYGTVIASGTPEDKIYFTSYTDDSLGGDSNGDGTIPHDDDTYDARGWYFYSTSNNSSLNNIVIKYSSDGFVFQGTSAKLSGISVEHTQFGIVVDNSTLSLSDISSTDSGTTLYVDNKSVITVSSSTIADSLANALSLSNSTFSVSSTSIVTSGKYEPIFLTNSTGTISSVVLDGGAYNGIDANKSYIEVIDASISNFSSAGVHISGGIANIASSTTEHNEFGVYYQPPSVKLISSIGKSLWNMIDSLFLPKVYADVAPVSISSSDIEQNTSYGVFNSASVSISAENNYWGDDTGPLQSSTNQNGKGNQVTDGVDFIPWTEHTPQYSSCCSSVLFFPGIEMSRLYQPAGSGEDKLWEPNISSDVKDLLLDSDGKSINKNVYTRDVMSQISVFGISLTALYKSFDAAMNTLVTQKRINAWQAIPYDWRFGLDEVFSGITLQDETLSIENQITSLASSSKTGKVTLIGHSNGGLLAKYILKRLQDDGKAGLIDKLILVGTPELGTQEAVSALLHGDDQSLGSGILLSQSLARSFGENMPSLYNLLPSAALFASSTTPIITFDPSIDVVANFRNIYGGSVSSAEVLDDFLLGKDGRQAAPASNTALPAIANNTLLNRAAILHSDLDTFTPPANIQTFQIAGFGRSTTDGIEYFAKNPCGLNIFPCTLLPHLDHKSIKTLEGDGTVVADSATAASSTGTYFVNLQQLGKDTGKNYSHENLLEAPSVIDSIENMVQNDIPYIDKYITSALYHALDTKKIELSVHSPVTLGVTNSRGQYTGVILSPDSDISFVSEEIPNSSYEETGEGKYIYLDDADDQGALTVTMKGMAAGTFTYEQTIYSDDASTTEIFSNIPVTASSTAEVVINPDAASSSNMSVDYDGDGKTDKEIQPDNQDDQDGAQISTSTQSASPISSPVVSASQYAGFQYVVHTYIDPITRQIKKYICVPIEKLFHLTPSP